MVGPCVGVCVCRGTFDEIGFEVGACVGLVIGEIEGWLVDGVSVTILRLFEASDGNGVGEPVIGINVGLIEGGRGSSASTGALVGGDESKTGVGIVVGGSTCWSSVVGLSFVSGSLFSPIPELANVCTPVPAYCSQ